MRQVVCLSLPADEVRQMRATVKKRGYRSVSAYVKHLFRADQDLISEAEILKAVREAHKEYQQGRLIKADSIADLL